MMRKAGLALLVLALVAGASSVSLFYADDPQQELAALPAGVDSLAQRVEDLVAMQEILAARLDDREQSIERTALRVASLENIIDDLSRTVSKLAQVDNRSAAPGEPVGDEVTHLEEDRLEQFRSYIDNFKTDLERGRVIAQDEEAAVKQDFLGEERDPVFADKMETKIATGLLEKAPPGVSLSYLECRSRVCQVEYDVEANGQTQSGTMDLDVIHAVSSQFGEGALEIYQDGQADNGNNIYFRVLD